MTTGERIQKARKAAKMSQKELGEKIGVSASMIGQYENNIRNPKIDKVLSIASILGVSASELSEDLASKELMLSRVFSSVENEDARNRLIKSFTIIPEELYDECLQILEDVIAKVSAEHEKEKAPEVDPEP